MKFTCEPHRDTPVYRSASSTQYGQNFVIAHAKNKPPSSNTVHYAAVKINDDDSLSIHPSCHNTSRDIMTTVCGVMFSGAALRKFPEQGKQCTACLWRLDDTHRVPRPEHPQDPAQETPQPARWAGHGEHPRAHFYRRTDGLTEVSVIPLTDHILTLIKSTPGRRWDQSLNAWVLPDVYVTELSNSFIFAGCEVRTTWEQQ